MNRSCVCRLGLISETARRMAKRRPWPSEKSRLGGHQGSGKVEPRLHPSISLRRMSWNQILRLPSCRVEEFSFSRLSRSGRSGLRNGCEGRTPLAWESRDNSHLKPIEAFELCRLKMRSKEKPRTAPRPFSQGISSSLSSGRPRFQRSRRERGSRRRHGRHSRAARCNAREEHIRKHRARRG